MRNFGQTRRLYPAIPADFTLCALFSRTYTRTHSHCAANHPRKTVHTRDSAVLFTPISFPPFLFLFLRSFFYTRLFSPLRWSVSVFLSLCNPFSFHGTAVEVVVLRVAHCLRFIRASRLRLANNNDLFLGCGTLIRGGPCSLLLGDRGEALRGTKKFSKLKRERASRNIVWTFRRFMVLDCSICLSGFYFIFLVSLLLEQRSPVGLDIVHHFIQLDE